MNVPAELIGKWDQVYRTYAAMDSAGVPVAGHAGQAMNFARASWDVADAWRRIVDSSPLLPWWVRAAAHASVQVFMEQARHWEKISHEWAATSDSPGAGGR
ncbi:MAG: hypothetical protein M3443_03810 [Actinomycetota bacterium]|nr:hypothetical protein [Actinomycetota bacterium]